MGMVQCRVGQAIGRKEITSGIACGSEHCVCLYQKMQIFLHTKFESNKN